MVVSFLDMIDFRAARGAGRGTAFLPRTARKAARGDARPPAYDSSRAAPGGTSVCCPRRSTPPFGVLLKAASRGIPLAAALQIHS